MLLFLHKICTVLSIAGCACANPRYQLPLFCGRGRLLQIQAQNAMIALMQECSAMPSLHGSSESILHLPRVVAPQQPL